MKPLDLQIGSSLSACGHAQACLPRDELFLAIDYGGSKSDCMIARGDADVLAWGSHRQPGVSGRSSRVIGESVRAALARFPEEETRQFNLCLPGVPNPRRIDKQRYPQFGRDVAKNRCRVAWSEVLPKAMVRRVCSVTESAAALALHGLDEGIVALGGTGAFVHVHLPSRGVVSHYDGYGPLLGDSGSAYQIGLAAFRAAASAHWSERRATSLRPAVFEAMGLASLDAAIVLSLRRLDRSLLASLAPIVEAEALKGDAVARSIILDAADALAETLFDALAAGRVFDVTTPLVGTGAIATRCPLYWERFCERSRAMAPGLQPMVNPRPAVLGILAKSMALRHGLTGAEKTDLANRLIVSYDAKFSAQPKGPLNHVSGCLS